jgi:hypothetical protein
MKTAVPYFSLGSHIKNLGESSMKRIGLNALKLSLLSIGLSGMFFTFLIFNAQIVGADGQVTVDCPGGTTVQCDGYRCEGTSNVGCTCRNAQGTITDQQKCKKAMEEMEEPPQA